MIACLLTAKIHAAAERRTSKAGREYVNAKAYTSNAEGERQWLGLTAFDVAACDALLALQPGDSVAVAGAVKVRAYIDKQGEPAASLDVVVDKAMSLYQLKGRKEAASKPAKVAAPEFDDALPWETTR